MQKENELVFSGVSLIMVIQYLVFIHKNIYILETLSLLSKLCLYIYMYYM